MTIASIPYSQLGNIFDPQRSYYRIQHRFNCVGRWTNSSFDSIAQSARDLLDPSVETRSGHRGFSTKAAAVEALARVKRATLVQREEHKFRLVRVQYDHERHDIY